MEDILLEIALHCKLRTVINIMRVLPQLDNVYFWKLKCEKDYPGKNYLECWTGKENYLIHSKKSIFLNMNTDYHDIMPYHVDKYIYEYTNLIKKLKYPGIDEYENLEVIQLYTIKQYILIMWDQLDGYAYYHINTYDTEAETFAAIKEKQNTLKDEYINIAILNLAYMSPYFIKYGCIKKRKGDYVTYYKGYKYAITFTY